MRCRRAAGCLVQRRNVGIAEPEDALRFRLFRLWGPFYLLFRAPKVKFGLSVRELAGARSSRTEHARTPAQPLLIFKHGPESTAHHVSVTSRVQVLAVSLKGILPILRLIFGHLCVFAGLGSCLTGRPLGLLFRCLCDLFCSDFRLL